MANKNTLPINDERFEYAVSFVLAHEGGYSNDIDDDGGETKFWDFKLPGSTPLQLTRMAKNRRIGCRVTGAKPTYSGVAGLHGSA